MLSENLKVGVLFTLQAQKESHLAQEKPIGPLSQAHKYHNSLGPHPKYKLA